MALVVICGHPCSGKSTTAHSLMKTLTETDPKLTIRIIDEETSFNLDRNQTYAAMDSEKILRGVLRSEVDRSLSKDTIIIVDSLNSIKGYRYELWCLARTAGTRYCLIYCDAEIPICRIWNQNRRKEGSPSYSDNIFEDLVSRFEKPDERNRWDSPLFENSSRGSIVDDVVKYLTKKVGSRTRDVSILMPTLATQNAPLMGVNSLYEMDRATQCVINGFMEAQSQWVGGSLNIGMGLPEIHVSRLIGLPELRKLRRTFLKLTGQSSLSGPPPPSDAGSAKRMFVDYLIRELETH